MSYNNHTRWNVTMNRRRTEKFCQNHSLEIYFLWCVLISFFFFCTTGKKTKFEPNRRTLETRLNRMLSRLKIIFNSTTNTHFNAVKQIDDSFCSIYKNNRVRECDYAKYVTASFLCGFNRVIRKKKLQFSVRFGHVQLWKKKSKENYSGRAIFTQNRCGFHSVAIKML